MHNRHKEEQLARASHMCTHTGRYTHLGLHLLRVSVETEVVGGVRVGTRGERSLPRCHQGRETARTARLGHAGPSARQTRACTPPTGGGEEGAWVTVRWGGGESVPQGGGWGGGITTIRIPTTATTTTTTDSPLGTEPTVCNDEGHHASARGVVAGVLHKGDGPRVALLRGGDTAGDVHLHKTWTPGGWCI